MGGEPTSPQPRWLWGTEPHAWKAKGQRFWRGTEQIVTVNRRTGRDPWKRCVPRSLRVSPGTVTGFPLFTEALTALISQC